MYNISPSCAFTRAKLGNSLHLTFYLHNNDGQNEFPGGILEVLQGAYVQKCSSVIPKIPPSKDVEISMVISVCNLLSFTQIPSRLNIVISTKNKDWSDPFGFTLDFGIFSEDIKDYSKPGGALNILFFGLQGACKSSTINSWFKMLKRDARFKVAESGAHYAGTTIQLSAYRPMGYSFQLIDTWGETLVNYRANEFEKLLEGKLPIGHRFDSTEAPVVAGRSVYIPDCVVFFTPVQAVRETAWRDKLSKHIREVVERGIPYHVILTKVDEVDPSLEINPDAESPEIDGYKAMLAKAIGMESYKIDHVVNYHGDGKDEPTLNFAKDRHAYLVLRKVLDSAKVRAETINKNDVIVC